MVNEGAERSKGEAHKAEAPSEAGTDNSSRRARGQPKQAETDTAPAKPDVIRCQGPLGPGGACQQLVPGEDPCYHPHALRPAGRGDGPAALTPDDAHHPPEPVFCVLGYKRWMRTFNWALTLFDFFKI